MRTTIPRPTLCQRIRTECAYLALLRARQVYELEQARMRAAHRAVVEAEDRMIRARARYHGLVLNGGE